MKRILGRLALLPLLWATTMLAAADEQIRLRVADSLPATHLFTQKVTKPWMEAVTRVPDGTVVFEHYPAEQLGKAKDMLNVAVSGVADIAFVVPTYITDKLPLSGVYELPGAPFSSCEGVKAFMALATGDGILARDEFAPNGIRVLAAVVQPPFQVITTHKPISSIADLKGMKIRTAGGEQEITTQKLGTIPVKITAPETAEAMSRGTIDGAILAHVSVGAYGLTELIKYATNDANFASAALTWVIGEKRFQSFPENVRKAMVEAGRQVTMDACRSIEADLGRQIDEWKAKGVTIITFSDADQKKLQAMFSELAQQWANGLDRRGKPGSEVLAAFQQALAAAK